MDRMPQPRWIYWKYLLATLMFFAFAGSCQACEPVIVWIIAAGPQFMNFNLIILALVVLAKAGAFPFFERRIDLWWPSCWLPVLARHSCCPGACIPPAFWSCSGITSPGWWRKGQASDPRVA